MTAFTEEQLKRYSRQILLPEVGGKGQKKITEAKVLIVGAGGLGSPASLYLAAAGVGTIGIIDNDRVDLSNLQRQILHNTQTVAQPKAESAKTTLLKINPDVFVTPYCETLTSKNIIQIVKEYDLIVDGSDNFMTRFLVNDAAFFLKKPVIFGSIFRFEGQWTTFKPYEGEYPCYRCLYPEPPPSFLVPSCQEAGVLGILAGTIGTLQATETLKEILKIGHTLAGTLLTYDALESTFRSFKVPKMAHCPLCGPHPTIETVTEIEAPCSLPPV